jgi:hypothetical protein
LDISFHRKNSHLHVGIHRKPTQTDTTIHFTSINPLEHKPAAYNFYINRMIALPITEKAKQQEWNTILTVAKKMDFHNKLVLS